MPIDSRLKSSSVMEMFLTSDLLWKVGVLVTAFLEMVPVLVSVLSLSLSLLDVTFDFLTVGDTLRRRAQTSECSEGFERTFQRLLNLL